MSRSLSLNMRHALNAQQSGEVAIVLLTVTHPDLATPMYLSSDPTTRTSDEPLTYGTVSRGNAYLFVPMQVTLPDDKEDSPAAAKLVLSNVSLSMIDIVRSVESPASVLIEIVLASALNTVEMDYPPMDLVSAEADASSITLTLSSDIMMGEDYPTDTLTPANFPGLFQ